MSYEIFETRERLIENNDAVAAGLRAYLREKGVFFVNVMASPGAGKTTLLEKTIDALKADFRIGVMEADAEGETDAARLEKTGVKLIQLHTGGLCHMDADMTHRGIERLGVEDVDLLFLENVGNLVCPAEFDVGADLSLCLLSVPEGDDKPLKYPLMFTVAQVILVSKTDVMPVFDFDLKRFEENVRRVNETAPILPVCVPRGEGFDAWIRLLKERMAAK